jgi:two-component system, NarL family, response regulator LiaR
MEIKDIIVYDVHPIIGIGLKAILAKTKAVGNIYMASSETVLFSLLNDGIIGLVILDSNQFSADSVLLVSKLKLRYKQTKVALFNTFFDPIQLQQFYTLKVDAYVKKDCPSDEIIKAVEVALQGEKYYCDQVKQVLFDFNQEKKYVEISSDRELLLSKRELEVIKLICARKNYKQIAEILFVSENTVRKHKQNLMLKTKCHNATDIYEYALNNNLIA